MGITALFMQYFRKGLAVVARNLQYPACRIKVVMFQLIINIAMEKPTIAALRAFTLPIYSGPRNNELAPKLFMKVPLTVLKRINQKMRNTWYFRKCNKNNCIGNE
jgi:hypothetical protein